MRGGGFVVRYTASVLALAGSWLVGAHWLVPRLIAAAYHERSFGFLNRIIAGRDVHPLDKYLQDWEALTDRVEALLAVAAIGAFVALLFRLPERLRAANRRLRDQMDRATEPMSATEVLLVAACGGLGVGAWTGGFLAYMSLWRGQALPGFRLVSLDVIWMSPVADLLVFLALGALLAVVGFTARPLRSRRWVIFVLLSGALLAGLMLPGWLHAWSAALLAVGISYQASRYLAAAWHPGVARGIALGLGALTLVAAGFTRLVDGASERAALEALPPIDTSRPNVLLVVMDAVRARNLSVYGYGRPTSPGLERLAREGVVFDLAIATSPWSLPSHASMLTGRYNVDLGTDFTTPLDETHRTLAEELSAHGYYTVASVANLIFGTPAFGLAQGFARFEAEPLTLAVVMQSSWIAWHVVPWIMRVFGQREYAAGGGRWIHLTRKDASVVNREILDALDEAPQRPFFAFLNYFDAHAPYEAPSPFDERFVERPYRYSWSGADPSARELEELEAAYDNCLSYVDHQLQLLLRGLEERGLLENTLVLVTSDHGEAFREHGASEHASGLHLEQIRVPLLVRFPGRVPSGVRVSEPVSIRSIPATVMEVLGIPGGSRAVPARSLVGLWRGDGTAGRPPVLSELNEDRSLVTGRWHYIRQADGEEMLYDLRIDPLEERNLVARSGMKARAGELRALLARMTGDSASSFAAPRSGR